MPVWKIWSRLTVTWYAGAALSTCSCCFNSSRTALYRAARSLKGTAKGMTASTRSVRRLLPLMSAILWRGPGGEGSQRKSDGGWKGAPHHVLGLHSGRAEWRSYSAFRSLTTTDWNKGQ